jgi:AP-3 complex subunit beta
VEDPSAVPEDLALLLRVAAPLLRSRNSGVVLAVALLFSSVGAHEAASLPKVGRALVRVCRNYREIQYVVLSNIVTLARASPAMFRDYAKDFFVAESEPAFVRRMKVDVLAALVDAENAGAVLREFTRYVKDDDKDFVRHAIQAVVRIANALPEMADKCLRGLMGLVASGADGVVAEAVVAIRQLLQAHSHHDALVVRLVKRLDKIASPSARAAIVWVLGEFQAKPKVAAMAPDMLRVLVKGFAAEAGEVKAQIVNLAAKASLHAPGAPAVQALFAYALDLARYDPDYDLRDRARLLRYLVLGSEVTQLADDALEEAGAAIALPRAASAAAAATSPESSSSAPVPRRPGMAMAVPASSSASSASCVTSEPSTR